MTVTYRPPVRVCRHTCPSTPIASTPSSRRRSAASTSAPFSSTARFNTPHEQCRSRAHASTLFDLSTTSATAHHTAASVKRLPSSAIWVRSSVHERAHAIHSYRLTRTSRCTACWPTGMCTNRRRHEERTRPMPPHSRQYRTVPSTGSQPISHTPAHEPAVTCLCETGFKRSLSKPSKTRPSNTLDSIPSRAVSFTFFNHTPNQTARPIHTKMRRAGATPFHWLSNNLQFEGCCTFI